MTAEERISKALEIAVDGGFKESHHRMWVIDQMVRALTDCPIVVPYSGTAYRNDPPHTFEEMGESDEYFEWVATFQQQSDRRWDVGIAP